MNVTDQTKARSALAFLATVSFAEVGLILLSAVGGSLIATLSSEGFDRWLMAEQLLWLAASVASFVAFFQLSRAIERTEPVIAVLVLSGLIICTDLAWLVMEQLKIHDGWRVFSILSIVISLAMTIGLCAVYGQLSKNSAFAFGIGAFALVRTLISVSFTMRLYGDGVPPAWSMWLRTAMSLFISAALGAFALHARTVISGPLPRAPLELPPQPAIEASGMRMVFAGVALLVLGIGGTVISYDLASSGSGGGRYFIATGAIATGLVQLVRGLTRLGQGK